MNILTKAILLILAVVVFIGIFYSVTTIPDESNAALTCFMAALLSIIGTASFAFVGLFRPWFEDRGGWRESLYCWMVGFASLAGTGTIFAIGMNFVTVVIAAIVTLAICIAIYAYLRRK